MNVREMYESRVEFSAAATQAMSQNTAIIAQLGKPKIVADDVLQEWIAFNYLFPTEFTPNGRPVMGEIGGYMPTHPEGGMVLGVCDLSVRLVLLASHHIGVAESKGNDDLLRALEEELDDQLGYVGEVVVPSGLKEILRYDFYSRTTNDGPIQLLRPSAYLQLLATGNEIQSNKCLGEEQYVLGVPVREEFIEQLRNIYGDDAEARRKYALRRRIGELIPPNAIAGFHIEQKGIYATLNPLVAESEMEKHYAWLDNRGLEPVHSGIQWVGDVDPVGHCFVKTFLKDRL
ncbi:hypothetical protein ACFL0V_03545 [Nanoarchaeota archaeon]